MSTDLTLAIRLQADGSDLIGEVKLSRRALDELAGAVDRTAESNERAARGSERLRGKLKSLSARASRLRQEVMSLRSALLGIGSALLARDIARAGTAMEGYRSALIAVTGSARLAAQELEFVRAEARRLGIDVQAAAESYTSLAAAAKGTALQGQATRDIFRSVAQAARVMNLSSADTEGALRALAQMMSKGTVQAEELRGQLGERIPGAFQIAARALGVSTQELNKLLERGAVLADDLLPKMARELDRTFAKGLQQATGSADAAFKRLGTSLYELKVAIAESGFLDFLASASDKLRGMIASIRELADGIGSEERARELYDRLIRPNAEFLRARGIEPQIDYRSLSEVQRILGAAEARGIDLEKQSQYRALEQQMQRLVEQYMRYQRTLDELAASGGAYAQAEARLQALITQTGERVQAVAGEYAALADVQQEVASKPVQEAVGTNLDQLALAEELLRKAYTPLEQFNEEMLRLHAYFFGGIMDAESYVRAMRAAASRIDDAGDATARLADETAQVRKAIDPVAQIYRDTATGIRNAFRGAFRDLLDGTNSLAERMLNMFKNLLADMATMAIARPVIVPVVSGLGAMMGVPGDAQAQVLGQLGMAGMGATTFQTGIQAGLAGGFGAASSLASTTTATTAAGAYLGAAMPYLAAIAGAYLVNEMSDGRLFGTGWRDDGQGMELAISGGRVGGRRYRDQYRRRMLFGGTARRTEYRAIEADMLAAFQDTFDSLGDEVRRMAGVLGVSAADALANFSASVRLSLDGLDAEQARQRVDAWFGAVGLEMARAVLGGVDDFRRAGESARETFQRLGEALTLLQSTTSGISDQIAIISGTASAAQINISNLNTAIGTLYTRLGNTDDIQARIELEAQLFDQVMQRYQAEQQMLDEVRRSIAQALGGIASLRASVAGDVGGISGLPGYRSPADIGAAIAGVGAGLQLPSPLQMQWMADFRDLAVQRRNELQRTLLELEQARQVFEAEVGRLAGPNAGLTQQLARISAASVLGENPYAAANLLYDASADRASLRSLGLLDEVEAIAALKDAVAGFGMSLDEANAAVTEAENAFAAAQADYIEALSAYVGPVGDVIDQLSSLREETLRYYDAQRQLDGLMSASASALGSTLTRLRRSQLSPVALLDDLRAEFATLVAGASSLGGAELASRADQINSLVDPLLAAAREVYASGQGYADILDLVTGSLTDLQNRLLAERPQDYEQQTLSLLGSIDASLGVFEGQLQSAEQVIVDAINASKDATVGVLEDIRGLLGGEGRRIDGSNAKGLAWVPFDGYVSELHKGEAVIDAQTMAGLRRYGLPAGGGADGRVLQVLERIEQALRESDQPMTVQIIGADGRVIREQTIEAIRQRSRRGEPIIYDAGVVTA